MDEQSSRSGSPDEPRLAGIGRRAGAVIVDTLLVFFGLGYAVGAATGNAEAEGGSLSFELHGAPAFLWFALAFAYFIVLETALGATLGKLLFGIRVRREDGERIGFVAALVRNLLRVVDGLFCYLLGAILAWTSPSRQRIGDRVAHTIVVRSG